MKPNTTVYLLFDKDAQLLYIGVTGGFHHRMEGHIQTKPWWDQVAGARFEHFTSRVVALQREEHLIKTMDPPYNVRGRGPTSDSMAGRFMRSGKLPEALVAKAVKNALNDYADLNR